VIVDLGALFALWLCVPKVTEDTGTRTTRTQNEILQSLSDEDLVTVASASQC
jgi:hypothetical protein